MRDQLVAGLFRDPTEDEVAAIRAELERLDAFATSLAAEFSRLSADEARERALALKIARLSSSNSLLGEIDSRGPAADLARVWWDEANETVQRWIAQGEPVSIETVARLNGLLTRGDAEPSRFRMAPVYSGPRPYADAAVLDFLMGELQAKLLSFSNAAGFASGPDAWRRHPAWLAAQARYYIVSVHPFSDGNGRTSTLVGDWILMKHGLPPFCFLKMSEATVAFTVGGNSDATPARAFLKSALGIRKAFSILLDREV